MLNKEQLETLLSKCLDSDADFAEIFEEDTTSQSIQMLNGLVEEINQNNRSGIGVRIYKDCQTVYGYTNDLEMESLLAFVSSLKEAFGNIEKQIPIQLNEEIIENKHPVLIHPIEADLKDKIDLLKKAYRIAKHYDSRIFKVQTNLLSVCQNVQISNTEGKWVKDVRIRTRMPVSSYAKDKDQMQSGFEGPGASMGLEGFVVEAGANGVHEDIRVFGGNLAGAVVKNGLIFIAFFLPQGHQVAAEDDIVRLHVHADAEGFQRRSTGKYFFGVIAHDGQIGNLTAR